MRKTELPRKRPIFLDPRGRRARYTNAVLLAAGTLLLIGLTIVTIGVIWGPGLLRPQFDDMQMDSPRLAPRATAQYEPPIGQIRIREPSASNTSALRFAFYSTDSFASLREHAGLLDGLLPNWYTLSTSNGTVTVARSRETAKTIAWLRTNAEHVAIFPCLSIPLESREVQESLALAAKRKELVSQIAGAVTDDNLAGVTIEYSFLSASLILPLVDFSRELGDLLHADGRKLIVSVDSEWDRYLVHALASFADYVVLNTDNELPARAQTGSIASQGWFERTLKATLSAVPANKLIVSIGAFGYDFDGFGNETQISVQRAWDLLSVNRATFRFDKSSMSSTFVYKADNGHWHQVWFADAVSAYNQLRTAFSVSPAGIAISRLGLEDPGLWDFAGLGRFPDKRALSALAVIPPAYGGLFFVRGPLVQVKPGHSGSRQIHFNPTLGLIDNQIVGRFPRLAETLVIPATGRMTGTHPRF